MNSYNNPINSPSNQTDNGEQPMVVGAAGKLVLAAIGAVALAGDAVGNMLQHAVERGELTQKDAQKKINALRAKGPHIPGRGSDKSHGAVADVPSKEDIQTLHDQIAMLSLKLDRLSQTPVEEPPMPFPHVKSEIK